MYLAAWKVNILPISSSKINLLEISLAVNYKFLFVLGIVFVHIKLSNKIHFQVQVQVRTKWEAGRHVA